MAPTTTTIYGQEQAASNIVSNGDSTATGTNGAEADNDPKLELITYLFPDFNAVNYFQREFEQDNEFNLIEYTKAKGFDIYMVEQWVTNRNIGTLISTYTGNPNSEVSVVKFTIVKKPSKYYPIRFQEYLNELMMNHSKIKQMNRNKIELAEGEIKITDEYLFITNITALPSHLSLIPILGGDVRVVQDDFIVNSNLKRLHCSGRSISLITPKISDASEDKFRQMYKIYNLNIPIKFAIKEMVNIIQTCLFYFDLIDARYCDGLLCSKTEEAIINWWNLIGLPHFNIKPNHRNEILPARSVAAIISLILSARIRLQIFGGCDAPKDPFEFENFMISIGEFQRQVKLEKRRKLNVETLGKLFYITNSKLNPDKYKYNTDTGDLSLVDGDTNGNNVNGFNSMDNDFIKSTPPRNNNIPYGNNGVYASPKDLLTTSQMNTPIKRNKRYTKEFRKLTSAVKSTVQDRIYTVGKPDDGAFLDSNPNKSTGRLRDRLAKLGDSTNPFEVETLDLELLVNNYMVGRTLHRLWRGVSSHKADDNDPLLESDHLARKDLRSTPHTSPRNRPIYTSPVKPEHHHSHNHSHKHEHSRTDTGNTNQHDYHVNASTSPRQGLPPKYHLHSDHNLHSNKLYKFVSLKDALANTQRIQYDSRYYRGLNKMKLGLQKNLLSNPPKKYYNTSAALTRQKSQKFNPNLSNGLSKIDALLKIPNEVSDEEKDQIKSECNPEQKYENKLLIERNNLISKFDRQLNRRNSYPFIVLTGENNLNILELGQEEPIKPPPKLFRRNSMSLLETHQKSHEMVTIEKIGINYIKTMSDLIYCDEFKKYYNSGSKDNYNILLEKRFCLLNDHLDRLRTNNKLLENNQMRLLKEDLPSMIDINMRNLTTNIDRLVYESRIIVKRINELESNSKLLGEKLRNQNIEKLTNMINNLIFLNRFHKTFKDETEKNDIILRLTGDNKEVLNIVRHERAQYESNSYFRIIVTFIWDMLMFIFQLFKFDRSNMNLERIRGTWNKLDPNREYINRAYEFVGHDSTTDGSIVKRGSIQSMSSSIKEE